MYYAQGPTSASVYPYRIQSGETSGELSEYTYRRGSRAPSRTFLSPRLVEYWASLGSFIQSCSHAKAFDTRLHRGVGRQEPVEWIGRRGGAVRGEDPLESELVGHDRVDGLEGARQGLGVAGDATARASAAYPRRRDRTSSTNVKTAGTTRTTPRTSVRRRHARLRVHVEGAPRNQAVALARPARKSSTGTGSGRHGRRRCRRRPVENSESARTVGRRAGALNPPTRVFSSLRMCAGGVAYLPTVESQYRWKERREPDDGADTGSCGGD